MEPVKIILASDNHGKREALDYLRSTYADYDYLIHCGDSEMDTEEMEGFLFVAGNHDHYDASVPYQIILEAGGHRIYICHGHMDFMRYFLYASMVENARKKNCDTVFFGHVHTYQDKVQEEIRLLNPGSMYHNRDARHPSYMKILIDDEGIHAERVDYIPESEKNRKKGFLERLLNMLGGVE